MAFKFHLESLEGWFQNKKYPKALLDNQLKGVIETRQTSDQAYKKSNGLPLVLTYHPRLKNVSNIIKKYLVFLYSKEQVQIYLHPFLLFHSSQVLVLESILLGLKYNIFYVNVDHLVITKVHIRSVLMFMNNTDIFTIQYRVFSQWRVTK